MYERAGAKVYNTASVINPAGNVVTRYRKIFPFCPYEQNVTPGNELCTFDIPDVGRFGLAICYDMWFPELVRSLAIRGAEVILHPSMTSTLDRDVEVAIARASAAVNQVYFVSVNVADRLGCGESCVYGPGGELIHRAGRTREIIPVELDLGYLRRLRRIRLAAAWATAQEPARLNDGLHAVPFGRCAQQRVARAWRPGNGPSSLADRLAVAPKRRAGPLVAGQLALRPLPLQ